MSLRRKGEGHSEDGTLSYIGFKMMITLSGIILDTSHCHALVESQTFWVGREMFLVGRLQGLQVQVIIPHGTGKASGDVWERNGSLLSGQAKANVSSGCFPKSGSSYTRTALSHNGLLKMTYADGLHPLSVFLSFVSLHTLRIFPITIHTQCYGCVRIHLSARV